MQRVRDLPCGGWRLYLDVEIRRVACTRCGLVKQERLPWLAETPGYTKRFAFAVGRRCRTASLQVSRVIQFSPGMVIENSPAVARLVVR